LSSYSESGTVWDTELSAIKKIDKISPFMELKFYCRGKGVVPDNN
jgi:hypothetical protein